MIHSWDIGDIRVTSLAEFYGPFHAPEILYPDMDKSALDEGRDWLVGNHWYPAMNRLVTGIQIWIVHAGDAIILIDTGIGNNKRRATPHAAYLNTIVPNWLEAAGAPVDKITHVVMTHLHADHVGWNTKLENRRWVPTFPQARHFVPAADFAFFKEFNETGKAVDGGSFYDSVMPVVAAGLVEFIDTQTEIADCLKVVPAFGHSPGQLNYWIESRGEHAVFCGDVMHHPIQVARPDLNTRVDMVPDLALRTRHEFLGKAADTGALVMPCHFGPPFCGFARRQGNGFRFEEAPQGRVHSD